MEDECPTCDNGTSLDLSVGAFTQIATEEEGEVCRLPLKFISGSNSNIKVPISWQFND